MLFFRHAKTCNEKIVDYAYPVKKAIIISPLSGLSPEFPPKGASNLNSDIYHPAPSGEGCPKDRKGAYNDFLSIMRS